MSRWLPAGAIVLALLSCTASDRGTLPLDGAAESPPDAGADRLGETFDAALPDRPLDRAPDLAVNPGDAGACSGRPAGTICRAAIDLCDQAETCTGDSPACPENRYRPAGFECRAAAGECDLADVCSGTGPACPNSYKGPDSICRPAAGPCDLPEHCGGLTTSCPSDGIYGRGHPCAPAGKDATCDPADVCDGASVACPTNLAADGTPCDAANPGKTCSGGACAGTGCAPYARNGPAGCFTECLTDAQCAPGSICSGPPSPTATGTCAPRSSGPSGVWRTAPGYHGWLGPGSITPTPPAGPCAHDDHTLVSVSKGPFRILYYRDLASDDRCGGKLAYSTYLAPTATSAAKFGYVTGVGCAGGNPLHWPLGDRVTACFSNDFGPAVFADGSGDPDRCSPADWNVFIEYRCSL